MSYFAKSVGSLEWADLAAILDDHAAENVRLEFKLEVPDKDELLKKLSSFANTYGGDLIVGAAAGNDGVLTAIPGVAPPNSYKQTVVQHCYNGVAPLLEPFVSDPIPVPDSDRVVFVIRVPESINAPHFLNGRKGCYVRTDEFSQRFHAGLATYTEIAHLASRRELTVRRRAEVVRRAESRLEAYVSADYQTTPGHVGGIGATLKCWITPSFPVAPVIDEARLVDLLEETRVRFAGNSSFPHLTATAVRQHESALVLGPLNAFSFIELGVWANLFYAAELERIDMDVAEEDRQAYMISEQLAGHVLLYLEHAAGVMRAVGYEGSLHLGFKLDRIRGIRLRRPGRERRVFLEEDPSSRFDDSMTFELPADPRDLRPDPRTLLRRVLRTIGFGVGWLEVANAQELDRLVAGAYAWNRWREPQNNV